MRLVIGNVCLVRWLASSEQMCNWQRTGLRRRLHLLFISSITVKQLRHLCVQSDCAPLLCLHQVILVLEKCDQDLDHWRREQPSMAGKDWAVLVLRSVIGTRLLEKGDWCSRGGALCPWAMAVLSFSFQHFTSLATMLTDALCLFF